MHAIFPRSAKRHRDITGIFLAAVFLLACPAQAGNTWLDKGTNLLKTVTGKSQQTGATVEEIGAGLKDALRVGSERVVSRLGRVNGFNSDSDVHIPLPKQLNTVKSALEKIGMSGSLKDLELKLNRAAEAATPKAKRLFRQAIAEMKFDDVRAIYEGPQDAATRYFRGRMSPSLAREMRPVVRRSLASVGAVQAYDGVMKRYRSIPLVPEVKADLTDYVVEKGIDGINHYMAQEEAAIRGNPAKRTTELLRRVFGAK
ncbi:MAG: DUF4197 domain-containing protein [Deltaproteobacteria bacterium]|nr:DUF4197 domain-containing protein [Deltaproteobacteria bacterium]